MHRALLLSLVACSDHRRPPTPSPTPTPVAPIADAASPPAVDASSDVTANDLFSHPEWIDQTVTFDVYEGMYDDQHSSGAPAGGYDVQIQDLGATRLQLAPSGKTKLSIHAPARITGKVTKFEFGLRVLVGDVKPLAFPKPERLASVAELTKDGDKWSRRFVEVEADLSTGFEISSLGTSVWLDGYPDVVVKCEPKRPESKRMDVTQSRVRVVGRAYTQGRYGHLSMYDAKIEATEIVYLDPKRPECK